MSLNISNRNWCPNTPTPFKERFKSIMLDLKMNYKGKARIEELERTRNHFKAFEVFAKGSPVIKDGLSFVNKWVNREIHLARKALTK